MSPELETLDQLLGGDLSLEIIRKIYPDDDRFLQAITRLLSTGDVTLVAADKTAIPSWRWREVLTTLVDVDKLKLRITQQGIRRIK